MVNVEALHAGRVLVLVKSESGRDDIAATIDGPDHEHDVEQVRRAAA